MPSRAQAVRCPENRAHSNILRHAGCDRAELTLCISDDALVLDVRDQGRGFDPAAVTANGLAGMRERALLIGAELTLDATEHGGTVVRLEVPVAEAQR